MTRLVRPASPLQAKALLASADFFLMMTAYYLIKPVRCSLVITSLGSDCLPYLYILSAVVLGGLVAGYARLSRRIAPQRLMQGILGVLVVQLLMFRWLLPLPYAWISGLFYLWVSMFSVVIVTQFWMVVNDLFSGDEAKQMFGFIGAGGIAGGMAGGALTSLVVQWVATEDLLVIAAGVLGICAALQGALWRFHQPAPSKVTGASADAATAIGGERSAGRSERPASRSPQRSGSLLSYLKEFRYLRYLLILVVVAKGVSTIIDYQFIGFVEVSVSGKEARTAFFGLFFTGLSVASLAVQLLLLSWLFKRFGVHRTLAVLPIGLVVGVIGLLLLPGLAVVGMLALYDRSLNYSLGQTGKEVLYVPIPSEIRFQVKPLIDAAAFRLAQGMAGVGILLAQYLGNFPIHAFSLLALPLIGLWFLAIRRLRSAQPAWA